MTGFHMRYRRTGLNTTKPCKRLETPRFRRVLSTLGATVLLCLAPALSGLVATLPTGTQARTTEGSAMSTATLDLFKAVEVNDMPGVKAAITAGADITAKNAQGKTPADLAVDRGHFIIAHFLLSQRAPGTAPSRTAQPKPTEPKPRNLTPAPKKPTAAAKREPRTVPQPLQSARRFSPPPEKPAPETPDPAADLPPEPARALTPPPLKTAQTKSRFTTPPRKPPRPMPNAVDVTSAPGSGVDVPPAAMPAPGDPGAATLPPGALSDTALSEVPAAEPATDVTVLPAQLPADADAGLPPELSTPAPRAAPPGASETAQAPPAAAARPAPSTSAAPLGKVGQFFRNLVDMVTPDGPDRPPASAQAGRITEVPANRAATARTPSQAGRAAAAAPEVAAPSADDARLAQDLARSLGLEDAAAPAPSADVLPMKDIEGAGAGNQPAGGHRRGGSRPRQVRAEGGARAGRPAGAARDDRAVHVGRAERQAAVHVDDRTPAPPERSAQPRGAARYPSAA